MPLADNSQVDLSQACLVASNLFCVTVEVVQDPGQGWFLGAGSNLAASLKDERLEPKHLDYFEAGEDLLVSVLRLSAGRLHATKK